MATIIQKNIPITEIHTSLLDVDPSVHFTEPSNLYEKVIKDVTDSKLGTSQTTNSSISGTLINGGNVQIQGSDFLTDSGSTAIESIINAVTYSGPDGSLALDGSFVYSPNGLRTNYSIASLDFTANTGNQVNFTGNIFQTATTYGEHWKTSHSKIGDIETSLSGDVTVTYDNHFNPTSISGVLNSLSFKNTTLGSEFNVSGLNLSGSQLQALLLDNTGNPKLLFSGNDTVTGGDSNDSLFGGAGNNTLDGGLGLDTASYSGNRSAFTVTKNADGTSQVHSASSDDTLFNIERISFADGTLGLDTSGNAGQAYRLYQAAFDRAPDATGLGWNIRLMDDGLTLNQMADAFVHSAEFTSKFGASASLSNEQFIDQLYANVLHRTPDAPGLAWNLNLLNTTLTRTDMLSGFSESAENQTQLIGQTQDGIFFT